MQAFKLDSDVPVNPRDDIGECERADMSFDSLYDIAERRATAVKPVHQRDALNTWGTLNAH